MPQTIGHGTQFQLGNGGGPETFTAINGTTAADFGSNKVDAHDVTDMGTAGTQRAFIGGLENSGDLTVKVNVKPGDATQTSLFVAKDGLAHNMKVVYPGAVRTKSFAGIILSIDESIPDDKIPVYSVKIQITGPVTIS